MDTIWNSELKASRIPYFEEVRVRLSPGEYEEIERMFGYGSVQHFIERLVYEFLHNPQLHQEKPF